MSTGAEHGRPNNGSRMSAESVLSMFRHDGCVDLRKLAGQLGVDAANSALAMIVRNLERNRKIRRIGGKGRHAVFVLTTFEG